MKRSLAIALTYLLILLVPIGLGILLIPPVVDQIGEVAGNAPAYVDNVNEYVNDNKTLNSLDEKYKITEKLTEEANKLPDKAGDAAKLLGDIGVGFVNRIFAALTIFILSIFMVAAGPVGRVASSRCSAPSTRSESSAPCSGSQTRSATTSAGR